MARPVRVIISVMLTVLLRHVLYIFLRRLILKQGEHPENNMLPWWEFEPGLKKNTPMLTVEEPQKEVNSVLSEEAQSLKSVKIEMPKRA